MTLLSGVLKNETAEPSIPPTQEQTWQANYTRDRLAFIKMIIATSRSTTSTVAQKESQIGLILDAIQKI